MDLIDLYFQDNLTPEEAENFEALLDKDPQFQRDFQAASDIVEGVILHEESEFKNRLEDVEETLEQDGFFSEEEDRDIISAIQSESMKSIIEEVSAEFDSRKIEKTSKVVQLSKRRNLVKRLSIAASVLILILAGWYFQSDWNPGENYLANYFAPATDELSPLVARELDELGFGGTDPALLQQLENMMKAYVDERNVLFFQIYNENRESFSRSPFNNEIEFYHAQMLISGGRIEEAELILERLNGLDLVGYQDKIQWNLSLLYLEKGNRREAEELLLGISSDSEYFSRAKSLLQELNSEE